jgi:hypothetical protein
MGVALGRRVAKVSIPEKKEASTVLPDLASAVQPEMVAIADADLRRPRNEHSCKQIPRLPWPDTARTGSGQGRSPSEPCSERIWE